jgi:hypothetical protein
MSFKELDFLLLMNDCDIDYSSLSESMLKQLARKISPYIALSALTELLIRESSEAVPTAYKILSGSLADQYLRGTALKILFRMDHDNALSYMIELAPNCEPYVLNTMLDLLLYESDFKYELAAMRLITQRVNSLLDEDKEEFGPYVLSGFEQLFEPGDALLSNNGFKAFQASEPRTVQMAA